MTLVRFFEDATPFEMVSFNEDDFIPYKEFEDVIFGWYNGVYIEVTK